MKIPVSDCPRAGDQVVAVVVGRLGDHAGAVEEVIARTAGRGITRESGPGEWLRLVDISGRPDLGVGSAWPFGRRQEYPEKTKGGE